MVKRLEEDIEVKDRRYMLLLAEYEKLRRHNIERE